MDISKRDIFKPVELAISLPKGFAIEFKKRNWFDSIYFGMLPMSGDKDKYRPILYQFDIEHNQKYDVPLPNKILLTFYHPEKRRLSQLVGIVIIGGQPDIYSAYSTTKIVTPMIESLMLDKHKFADENQKAIIQETLTRISSPIKVKPILQILETFERKQDEKLTTFYPILSDENYNKEKLALPNDFQVDAAFVFGISDDFFTTSDIGGGLETLTLYAKDQGDKTIEGKFAIPLIVKWQPVYNDILIQLKKAEEIGFSDNYQGKIKPSVIIFNRQLDNSYSALISNVTNIKDKRYYNVAIARSGYQSTEGKPLSFLISALSREKFGTETWIKRMHEQDFSEDALFLNWKKLIDNIELQSEGVIDLGLLRSLKRKVNS